MASDATPMIEYTNEVVYLEDEEIAVVGRESGLRIFSIQNQEKTPYIQELELQLEAIEKGGYEHFMLKEIHEQPRSIRDCFRGRLNVEDGWRSEEHTSELQSRPHLVCRLLLEKKKKKNNIKKY